jgi:hypothetical protein
MSRSTEKNKLYMHEWYRKNRLQKLAKTKAYQSANSEIISTKNKKYRAKNAAKLNEYDRARASLEHRRLAHLEACKRYREANREKTNLSVRNYYRKHPEKSLMNVHNRLARKRAAGGKFTDQDIASIWERQGRKCAVKNCDKRIADHGAYKYQIDHIQAVLNGGSNNPENLQILCAFHNRQKGSEDEYVWAQKNGALFVK